MKQSQTVTGKRFYYDGNLDHGLAVRTCDKQGNIKDKCFRIYSDTINIIKKSIMASHERTMGSCRDSPAKDSIGDILRLQHKSPQALCYIIPLLKEAGYCDYFKKGRAYYIRFIKSN